MNVILKVIQPYPCMFGELISGPGAGEVTIMIKTVVSGDEDPLQVFSDCFFFYFSTIIVGGLELEARYRFDTTAANMFGAC